MFNFGPLGEFVVFVLAIAVIVGCVALGLLAIIVGCAILGLLAIIVEYIWVPIAVVMCIGLVSCTIRQSYIKIKSLLKKKVVEKELD